MTVCFHLKKRAGDCPECHGEGAVKRMDFGGRVRSYLCPKCKGTGDLGRQPRGSFRDVAKTVPGSDKDMAIVGAALLTQSEGEVADWWDQQMIAKFGPAVQEKLPEIKEKSAEYYAKVAEHLINKHIPDFMQIQKLWESGKFNAKWYESTFKDLAEVFGDKDASVLVDLSAITSAHTGVWDNARQAVRDLALYKAGLPFYGLMKKNLEQYRETGTFGGKKVNNFAKALKGDPDAVVVDIWMMRLFGFDERHQVPNEETYEFVENIIRAEASKLGVPPAEFQAALWTAYKQGVGDVGTIKPMKEVLKDAMRVLIQQGKIVPEDLGVTEQRAKETGVMPEVQQMQIPLAAGLLVRFTGRG